MLEQEIASIIKFTLLKAGNPSPYYNEVPEGFLVPSVFFPVPEVTTKGDTLTTYALGYTWFIKFFHKDAPQAHDLAFAVLTAIKADRNIIPFINTAGKYTGRGFRLKDSSLKNISASLGTTQLQLSWDSPRPYNNALAQKMMVYNLNMYSRSAYEEAVKQTTDSETGAKK